MLIRKARKVGTSLVVTIPSQMAEVYNIHDGDKLKIDFRDKRITIKKYEKKNNEGD